MLNISGFIRDLWSYESGNNFTLQTGNKLGKGVGEGFSAYPVSSKTLTEM